MEDANKFPMKNKISIENLIDPPKEQLLSEQPNPNQNTATIRLSYAQALLKGIERNQKQKL